MAIKEIQLDIAVLVGFNWIEPSSNFGTRYKRMGVIEHTKPCTYMHTPYALSYDKYCFLVFVFDQIQIMTTTFSEFHFLACLKKHGDKATFKEKHIVIPFCVFLWE